MLGINLQRQKKLPDIIYNVDETGSSIVERKATIVGGRKSKWPIAASVKRRTIMTKTACMIVAGHFVPLFGIFLWEKHEQHSAEEIYSMLCWKELPLWVDTKQEKNGKVLID